MVSQIAEFNFTIYFLSNELWNLNFGPFIGRVPEKTKSINMNMIIKIFLMLDFQAEFFC